MDSLSRQLKLFNLFINTFNFTYEGTRCTKFLELSKIELILKRNRLNQWVVETRDEFGRQIADDVSAWEYCRYRIKNISH